MQQGDLVPTPTAPSRSKQVMLGIDGFSLLLALCAALATLDGADLGADKNNTAAAVHLHPLFSWFDRSRDWLAQKRKRQRKGGTEERERGDGHVQAIRVNPDTHLFVDSWGRTRIFHGVNAVFKEPPYLPFMDGPFCAENSLNEEDADNLLSWGFNVVRLGVMWPGVEPHRGSYDMDYLDEALRLVDMLGRRGIYTIVDFHQDLLMRSCCGEGIPLWAEEVLLREIDNATKPFPWPVADPSAYQAPEDGEVSPLWSQCEQLSFLRYYFSAKVGAAFQGLYDNAGGVRDALGDYWRIVAETFSSRRSVLGYNLINEPWAGDIIQRPRLLAQPGLAERVNLQPLYNHLHSRIREVDDDHILFYEGFSWSYWPNGFDELPSAGSQGYEDRNALSYHIYCPLTDQGSLMSTACEPMNRQYFRMRDEDVMRIGGGSMMTEWGAVPHSIDHIRQMNQLGNMADEFLASWAYWSFKDYADVTTINGGSQALYEKNGLVPEKLAALARTFAHAVAGELHEMAFDPESKVFNLVFTPSSAASRDFLPMQRWIHQGVRERPSTTVIAVAMGINYPHGFNVDFDPPGSVSLLSADACAGGDKVYIENGRARVRTRVTIRPCEKESTPASCLCPAEAQSPPPFVLGINSFENMLKPPPFVNIKK